MCPDYEILSAFYDDEIEGPWKEKIEEHINSCKHCQKTIKGFNQVSCLLKQVPLPDFEEHKRITKEGVLLHSRKIIPFYKRHLDLPLPAAAACLLLFLAGGIIAGRFLLNSESQGQERPVVTEISSEEFESVRFNSQKEEVEEEIIDLPEKHRFTIKGQPTFLIPVSGQRNAR